MRKIKVWLGWDGAYVISKSKLQVEIDPSAGNKFLAPPKGGKCIDIHELDGNLIFKSLGLKKFDVVKLQIEVIR